jgi:hypothetical protein
MKNAMKKNLILLLTLILFSPLSAQVNGELDAKVLTKAHEMAKTFIAKDYEAFAKFSHPAVVKVMKGEKAMIQRLKKDFGELESQGITFLELKFSAPSKMITVENELQCTIPQQIVMLVPGGTLTATTTVIAISEDQGNNWYFIDTAGNNVGNMKALIPSLSLDLPVPMPQDPMFEPNEEETTTPVAAP